jgi:hypothetical protein
MKKFLVLILLAASSAVLTVAVAGQVQLLRVPSRGIQPQAVRDRSGVVHLVCFKGDPAGGDLFYVRRGPPGSEFSKPLPVNSYAGSAIAIGAIRGAQLAVGSGGRVHVVWNGRPPRGGTYLEAPLCYTRLNDARTAFEPERNLITTARGLDGGSSIAADTKGQVYVLWHAPKEGNTNDEAGRALFIARSADDGRNFAPETLATAEPTGACPCCGMKALADDQGCVFAFFRGASDTVNRNGILLLSRDRGAHFQILREYPWRISTCPMSSAYLSEIATGVLAAAETQGRVFFVRVNPKTREVSSPVSPSQPGKYPVAVGNARGEVLLAWISGSSWGKGGVLEWQVYGANGEPTAEHGRAEGVPAWSFAAAFVDTDGNFVLLY